MIRSYQENDDKCGKFKNVVNVVNVFWARPGKIDHI